MANHTSRCIENAISAISENNGDTLIERNPSRVWTGNVEFQIAIEALIAAGELAAEDEATGREWIACGNVSCTC